VQDKKIVFGFWLSVYSLKRCEIKRQVAGCKLQDYSIYRSANRPVWRSKKNKKKCKYSLPVTRSVNLPIEN